MQGFAKIQQQLIYSAAYSLLQKWIGASLAITVYKSVGVFLLMFNELKKYVILQKFIIAHAVKLFTALICKPNISIT